jgi:predicted MFS family arabinose efflux permease
MLMITMGVRQTSGLLVAPIDHATGVGIVTISFALAVGQFMWGVAQPVFGALADKRGSRSVLVFGGLLLAAGLALIPALPTQWGLVLTLGIITALGAGAGSFSILIGSVAQRLPAHRRSFAAGFINAGSSFGQFIFAPIVQALISGFGWVTAVIGLALAALLTIPLASLVGTKPPPAATSVEHGGLRSAVRAALADRSYVYLHAGFFTCGFHVAFLVTHLPGEVALCGHGPSVAAASLGLIGLFNIAGSLCAGQLGTYYRMKFILAVMYASRAVMILVYIVSPKTELTFYVFSAALGFTWLATVPPTAGLVGKLFGAKYLATLFGLTLLTHQVGGFLGAWLGGLAVAHSGDYGWMWWTDALLAAAAALVNLPINEERISRADRKGHIPA